MADIEFKEELPIWEAEGVKPPLSKIQEGWNVGDRPPADWWNWFQHRTFKSIEELRVVAKQLGLDLENIDVSEELIALKEEVEEMIENIPDVFHDLPQNSVKESMNPIDFEHGISICSQSTVNSFPTINDYGMTITVRGTHSSYGQIFITRYGDIWSRRSAVLNSWNGEWYNAKSQIGDLSKLKTKDKSNLVNAINETYEKEEPRPVGKVKDLSLDTDERTVSITWSDPEDTFITTSEGEDILYSEWEKTVVLRKVGSPSENINDGTIVVENGVRNQYKNKPFIDTGLEFETEYYYTLFAVSTSKGVSEGVSLSIIPKDISIVGVVIDESNSNPETRVTYIEDSAGFQPVRGNNGNTDWGSWKDTFIYDAFKPCVVKNGEVQYYLDKEDRTKKVDGSPAVLTGADGDVMVEIDLMWVDLKKVGSKQYVRISDAEQEGFQCLAHTNGDKEVDKIYVGAYLGYEQAGKLRSISGRVPTGDKTLSAFRTIAEANGSNYHQVPFYVLTLLQSVMVTMLKSTDTQTALGRGYVDGNNNFTQTGNTDTKGMMYGENTGSGAKSQMCFMGIEDFWGNKRWWIDGCKYDGGSIKTSTSNFNDNATGYKTVGNYSTGGGYIQSVKGDMAGFIPDKREGSDSTYYADYGYVYGGRFPYFGGSRSYESTAGGFDLDSDSASHSDSSLGARLFMYGR